MNILLGVHQFFPHHYTGTERYVLNLARQFLLMGHRVRVLTYDFRREARQLAPGGRLLIHEYSFQGVPVTAFSHPRFPDFTFDMLNDDFAEETLQLLQRETFDIYHCAHPLRIGGSLRAAKQKKLPVVLMLTDYWLFCPVGIMLRNNNTLCDGPDGGRNCSHHCFSHRALGDLVWRRKSATELAEYADRILAPSRFLIGVFHYNRFLEGRIRLARHGFDYTLLRNHVRRSINPNMITLGYIGTIQYHKGVDVLIRAFHKTKSRRLRLEIWGGCLHEADYQKRVMGLAAGDPRIEFCGEYDYADLKKVLQNLDLVVVPSVWYENAPLTITSSHAMGIPVIASAVGGMAEMVTNGVNGFTYPVGDVDALAEHLETIAAAPQLIQQFRDALVPPAGLEEEAFRMERLYRSLLEDGAQGHVS